METLTSPPHDIGMNAVTAVQTATTKIKVAITENITQGKTNEDLTKALNSLIAIECKKFSKNPQLQEQVRRALVTSSRKWYYELKESIKRLNTNVQTQLAHNGYFLSLNNGTNTTPIQTVRKILDTGETKAKPIIEDYERKVKIAVKALSAEPPKVVTTKSGHTYEMSLRNRAEMAVRYEANLQDINRLIKKGVKLVWTTSHPNASPRCMRYQGQLYSLDGTTGSINGIPYTPIDKALAGPLGDGNGIISGYNCRHRLIEYQDGSKAPVEFTETEIKHEYSLDRQQRRYENNIRQMKTEEKLLRASGFTSEASKLRQKWRIETAKYELFSVHNDRPYYPWRCRIDRDEKVEEIE